MLLSNLYSFQALNPEKLYQISFSSQDILIWSQDARCLILLISSTKKNDDVGLAWLSLGEFLFIPRDVFYFPTVYNHLFNKPF